MSAGDAARGLTTEQVAEFHREGYLVADGVFTEADLAPVIAELDGVVNRRAAELVAEGALSRTYGEAGFERQLALISAETDRLASSIWNGALHGPAIFDLIRHPKLLDVAESLCGPELIASSVYRLRPKVPRHGQGPVPWHQDSGYLEPYCDSALILTVWLPLVDATQERGCMWVQPRVHLGPVVKHRDRPGKPYLEIAEGDMPAGERLCVPVRKGGVLLLTNRTPHASFENESDIVRWSMDLRYQSVSLPTNAPLTRLPDDPPPVPGVPLACYPPEADFLVRSRKRPGDVVRDHRVFAALRERHQARPVTARWG